MIIKKFNHLKATNPNAAHFVFSFVVFLLLVIMGLAVIVKKNADAKDVARQIGHLKVLSNQMEGYLKPAKLGDVSAFIGLRHAAQAFDGQWQQFKQQHPYARAELKAVDETWQRMNKNTQNVLDGQKGMMEYKETVEAWYQTKRLLDVLNNQLLEALLSLHASSSQVVWVQNQAIALERMLREVNDEREHGGYIYSMPMCEDFTPRYLDVEKYSQVLTGLLQSDSDLGIDRVEQSEARKIIIAMTKLVDDGLKKEVGALLRSTPNRFQIVGATFAISRDLAVLHQQLNKFKNNHTYTTITVIIIFSALCAMVSLGGYLRAIKPIAIALPK